MNESAKGSAASVILRRWLRGSQPRPPWPPQRLSQSTGLQPRETSRSSARSPPRRPRFRCPPPPDDARKDEEPLQHHVGVELSLEEQHRVEPDRPPSPSTTRERCCGARGTRRRRGRRWPRLRAGTGAPCRQATGARSLWRGSPRAASRVDAPCPTLSTPASASDTSTSAWPTSTAPSRSTTASSGSRSRSGWAARPPSSAPAATTTTSGSTPGKAAASRRPGPRTTGLYHTAILYPDRAALADACHPRIARAGIAFDGAADHGVSEAVYLRDPDGNGVELYRDRAPADWPRDAAGQLAMVNAPLDLEALLAEAPVASGE